MLYISALGRVALLSLLFQLHGTSAAPAPLLSDYTHSSWDGLASAPVDVLKIAQSTDGWLWIATAIGLYRYDGIQFERTDTVHGQRLYSNDVLGLMASQDGALWVGYRLGGVSVFRKDGVRTFLETEGLPGGAVFHIEASSDGTVWVATRDGVATLSPGAVRFERQGAEVGLPGKRIYQILFGRDGTVWIASREGIYFRKPGSRRFAQAWPRMNLMSMAEAPDGTIWASDAASRYYRVRTIAPAGNLPPKSELKATALRFDSDGQTWVLQRDAVERRTNPVDVSVPAQRLTQANGLSGALPQAFFQDREGAIWLGTSAGIDRLRRNRLKTLLFDDGFDHNGMALGPDGKVWVDDVLGRIHGIDASGIKNFVAKGFITASHQASDGAHWTGDATSLRRYGLDGRVTVLALPDAARGFDPQALLQDASGRIWASFSGAGLFRFAQGQWLKDGGLTGFPAGMAMTMAMDSRGVIWMGHARNRISLIPAEPQQRVVRQLGEAAGLDLGNVLSLYRDGESMWVGGERGTMLYRDGRFVALTGRQGETFRGVSGILRRPEGDLWLHGAEGIFRIAATSLAAWLRDPTREVDFERFDALDGLRGHAPQLRPLPSLLQAGDGKLWFSTASGIAFIDPANIRRNPIPPPVLIRNVVSNGKLYATEERKLVNLPVGADSMRISFVALGLAMPERVRFRYRLEGVDRDWQEPVGRRDVSYTNLKPGNYRFQVTAANEDGVWNRDGALVDIHIPPTFVQTKWFLLMMALTAALVLYVAYSLRVRSITRRMRERLEARLEERSRIARSLHDTMLQSVQGMLMSFNAHVYQIPEGSHDRVNLERTIGLARRLLVEGRDQIMDLRASAKADEMRIALQAFGDELAACSGHAFELRVIGKLKRLKPLVSDEVFAIGREALCNASRYGNARTVLLELDYGEDMFGVRICDDGCGLDEAVMQSGHRPGHFGLPGMRERAATIGASFMLASSPEKGTEITVYLSAELAYQFSLLAPARPLARWWRRTP